jgi:hypothetical protein
MTLKILSLPRRAQLTCRWLQTGDPRQPLICRWVSPQSAQAAEAVSPEGSSTRLCA